MRSLLSLAIVGVACGLLGLSESISHAALSMSDFFCSEGTLSPPAYFETGAKNCGKQMQASQGVCMQNVVCTYLSDDVKKAAANSVNKKNFGAMTDAEKQAYFHALPSLDWFPSSLVCQGAMSATGPLCPVPEQCKGDLLYNAMPAQMNFAQVQAIQQRLENNEGRAFQYSPGQNPGPTGPAQ
jgi:hypothetical protein